MGKKANKNDNVNYAEYIKNNKQEATKPLISALEMLSIADQCFLASLSDYQLEMYKKVLTVRFHYIDDILKERKEKDSY